VDDWNSIPGTVFSWVQHPEHLYGQLNHLSYWG